MRTAHARAQIRQRRETDFWRTVNRFLFFLIVVAAVAATVMRFVPQFRIVAELQKMDAGLKKTLADLKLLVLQQQREVGWLNENPGYVSTLARDRLGVMVEGETVYRLDEPPLPAALVPAAKLPATVPAKPAKAH